MRSPSSTGRGGGADDDFAFYYSFFQDASPDQAVVAMPNNRRRKRGGDGDKDASAAPPMPATGNNARKRSIATIITSLAALDAEGHADTARAADASRRQLALLESKADDKSQAMMDYFAKMEGSFDAD